MGWLFAGMLLLMPGAQSSRAQDASLNLMPYPSSVQRGTGSLRIDGSFQVAFTSYREARLDRAGARFLASLHAQTDIPFAPQSGDAAKATLVIHTDRASKPIQELGEDESYLLEVTPQGARLNAANPLGVLHGLQTFLQLVAVTSEGFAVPAVTIHDQPRFPWRGLMVDTGRHFMPLAVIERNIDGMEAVKMNVFHWHLSENQGFRVESRKFPKLQRLGSDGKFYTQDEIRSVIAYARDRGMRVVPEFDVPGHSTAWFVGYPELASAPGPYQIERKWGVFDPAMNPANDKVYKFLDDFIGEMARLFPDHLFHIGGDEVNGKQWDANPEIQKFMKEHSLKDNHALQAYFNTRLQKIVSKHGKSMVGWDEILDPTLPKDIVIQSWRGPASLTVAAKDGYRGLLSAGYYLDLGWPAWRHYAADPLGGDAASLSSDQQKLILGGEACMWSEYVDAENIDSRVWPRNAVIAERLWSPQDVRDPASMYARMDATSEWLEWRGLTHRSYYEPMLERIAGPASPQELDALRRLADVLEPVKNYTREETAPAEPTSWTPLNRLVDAVAPESAEARRFSDAVNGLLATPCDSGGAASKEEITALRQNLTQWRDNDAKFAPLAQRSSLAKEGAAVSQNLAAAAQAGLAALDFIESKRAPDAAWVTQQGATLANAAKPAAQMLIAPVPAIRKLVDAADSGKSCGVVAQRPATPAR
jgi:hexosaminidase